MTTKNLVARLIDCWNTGQLDDIDNLLSRDFIRHEPEVGGRTPSLWFSSRSSYSPVSSIKNAIV